MKDTPRTDCNAGYVLDSTEFHCQSFEHESDGSYVNADFARELERELNAANQRIKQLENKLERIYRFIDGAEKQ